MKIDLIHALTHNFETHAKQTDSGIEFWLARDLQNLLGYGQWKKSQTILPTSEKWSN